MKTLDTVYFQTIGYRILSLLFSNFLFCICLQQLQWRHNEHNGVSYHQPLNFLLNRLRISNKTSKRRWPVNSPHKGPVMRKMFPLDVVIMITEKTSERIVMTFSRYVGHDIKNNLENLGDVAFNPWIQDSFIFCGYVFVSNMFEIDKRHLRLWNTHNFLTQSSTAVHLQTYLKNTVITQGTL